MEHLGDSMLWSLRLVLDRGISWVLTCISSTLGVNFLPPKTTYMTYPKAVVIFPYLFGRDQTWCTFRVIFGRFLRNNSALFGLVSFMTPVRIQRYVLRFRDDPPIQSYDLWTGGFDHQSYDFSREGIWILRLAETSITRPEKPKKVQLVLWALFDDCLAAVLMNPLLTILVPLIRPY